MAQLPKLKPVGKVTARPSFAAPNARASDYLVRALTINLRRIGPTACIVVWRHGQDPNFDGLHLAYDAARVLRVAIEDAARADGGSVEILNHRLKLPSLWARFSDADAIVLADGLAGATGP